MAIRPASDFMKSFLGSVEIALGKSAISQASNAFLERAYQEIDKLEHTQKKIAALCLTIFTVLCTPAAACLVAMENVYHSIEQISGEPLLHQTSTTAAACLSALFIAPAIAATFTAFTFATIFNESTKRFEETAPPPHFEQEAL